MLQRFSRVADLLRGISGKNGIRLTIDVQFTKVIG